MPFILEKNDFIERFSKSSRSDAFPREGLGPLYDFLTEVQGDEYETLDIIAICCDFDGYDDPEECIRDLSITSGDLNISVEDLIDLDEGVEQMPKDFWNYMDSDDLTEKLQSYLESVRGAVVVCESDAVIVSSN